MLDNVIKNKIFNFIYTPLLCLLACLIVVCEVEIYGAAVMVLIAAAMLVVSSRLTDAMLPVMLLSVFVTKLYDLLGNDEYRAQLFQIIWVAVPVVAAVIFHFVYYRKPFVIGRSFWGLCGISVALILGGVGTLPAEDYFSGALFYVLGLGVGMMAFYLLVKSQWSEDENCELLRVMYIMGLFASFCIVMFYVRGWDEFISTREFLWFQSKNNLSTFLMLAMPFPVFFAVKNPLHMLSTLVMYICMIFSGSRGGLLMGTVELFIILLAYVILYPHNLKQRIIAIASSVVFGCAVLCCIPLIARLNGVSGDSGETIFNISELIEKLKGYLVREDEVRFRVLQRTGDNFKSNPLFGVGMGYRGNEDIWSSKAGAMNWYHMWFAQVFAGLGILGVLTYGYQLVDRIIIFFKNRNNLTLTLMLSYIGLFLMSQVNPGEFCPAPYAMLGVTFFIIMEGNKNDKVIFKKK
ncbi:MAG: O-antigen ligase family protein [Clostridia bacterium]|nr:O-antigen ligase family protein [Clostridia bacterium]